MYILRTIAIIFSWPSNIDRACLGVPGRKRARNACACGHDTGGRGTPRRGYVYNIYPPYNTPYFFS